MKVGHQTTKCLIKKYRGEKVKKKLKMKIK